MSRRLLAIMLGAALLAPAAGAQEQPPAAMPTLRLAPAQNPAGPFDRARFEQAAVRLGATPEQLAVFEARVGELGVARAADDLLRAAVPAFDAAVRLHEAGDPSAAVALTRLLATAEPPLRAHVRYHLARLFLDSDDPELALQALDDFLRADAGTSALDAEATWFFAQALAEMPLPDAALLWFQAFLRWFPDASERFRATAHQRIGELERQQESRLHDLADGMKKTTRDLRKQRTGKPTQVDQQKYLEQLDQLIEEYQERENQSSGPASGLGPSSNPAGSSALPEGEGTVGTLNRRPSLADRWGDMKDADRDKIAAEVQKGLPPRYQKMLEQYYKKLGKAGGNQ